jgi:hypothetical protein
VKLEDLDAQLAAIETAVQQARALIADAMQARDPLAAHIYTARRLWRAAVASLKKSTSRIERVELDTFRQAQALKFKGTAHEWRRLLESGQ